MAGAMVNDGDGWRVRDRLHHLHRSPQSFIVSRNVHLVLLGKQWYLLVMTVTWLLHMAHRNSGFTMIYPVNMVNLHNYVSLPEGSKSTRSLINSALEFRWPLISP